MLRVSKVFAKGRQGSKRGLQGLEKGLRKWLHKTALKASKGLIGFKRVGFGGAKPLTTQSWFSLNRDWAFALKSTP